MDITWLLDEDRDNERRYGVSFAEAATVFEDAGAFYVEDIRDSYGPALAGKSDAGRLLYILHVEQSDGTVRIVRANRVSNPYFMRILRDGMQIVAPGSERVLRMPARPNPYVERIRRTGGIHAFPR